MSSMPCLAETGGGSEVPVVRLGYPLVDGYLEFVAARGRASTVLAAGYNLKVFFSIVGSDPVEVTTADVLGFITAQRGDRRVIRITDGESGSIAADDPASPFDAVGAVLVLGGPRRHGGESGAARFSTSRDRSGPCTSRCRSSGCLR